MIARWYGKSMFSFVRIKLVFKKLKCSLGPGAGCDHPLPTLCLLVSPSPSLALGQDTGLGLWPHLLCALISFGPCLGSGAAAGLRRGHCSHPVLGKRAAGPDIPEGALSPPSGRPVCTSCFAAGAPYSPRPAGITTAVLECGPEAKGFPVAAPLLSLLGGKMRPGR